MMKKERDFDILLKKTTLRAFALVIMSEAFQGCYLWYKDIIWWKYHATLMFILQTACWYILLRIFKKTSFSEVKYLLPIYGIFVLVMYSPNSIYFFNQHQLTPILWFLPLPFAITILYSYKEGVIWGFITLFSLILFFALGQQVFTFSFEDIYAMTQSEMDISNIISMLFSFALFLYLMFSAHRIDTAKREEEQASAQFSPSPSSPFKEETTTATIPIDSPKDSDKNVEKKYVKLYEDILAAFEKDKLYCNADLTTAKLASALNTNTSYIYKALIYSGFKNFNDFVNFYRIRYIKELIDKDLHEKYTIRHLHLLVGFKQQSTFNKVFKRMEGVTPSDYILLQSQKKKDAANNSPII